MRSMIFAALLAVVLQFLGSPARAGGEQHSVARHWNEQLLEAIRNDFARPTVHARNIFHTTIAMWDAWAIYDDRAIPFLMDEVPPELSSFDIEIARAESISYACYRVLAARFSDSPGAEGTLLRLHNKMIELGYDPAYVSVIGKSPAAIGNRVAVNVLAQAFRDNSNEQDAYRPNNGYQSPNPPMIVKEPGTTGIVDPNRWQSLAQDFFVDQAGNPIPQAQQSFLGPHWGQLPTFALRAEHENPATVYLDPGQVPRISWPGHDFGPEEDAEYKAMYADVVRRQSVHDPDLPATIDISPRSLGNNPLGTNDGTGRLINPVTGLEYQPNIVKLGDYGRCLAEFWADGPDSETPPGHWNTVANHVSDDIAQKRIGGTGPIVNDLEWDVKLYLALNGAVYDAAIAAWGVKGYYDSARPISAIRYMCEQGQSSDPDGPSYSPQGIPLDPGVIEVITAESSAQGERHAHLAEHIGEIAVLGWPGSPEDTENEYSGVVWMLGVEWVPYQRPTFVTPPFAGYVSGHSTFSRSAAEVLTNFTGSEYFPGGVGEFVCVQNEYLHFEQGPSETLVFQWATYYDAADQSGVSRIFGGIHPWGDDFPGRIMGAQIGMLAWNRAQGFYDGTAFSSEISGWILR